MTWKVKIGKGLRARCTNSLSMHLPNPIRALDVSSDGRHLATGCCFEMIDVLSEGRKQMSIRGTLKIWDMENVIQVASHPKANYQIIRHSQMRTMHQIVRSARQGGTSAKDRDFGIRALTFSPDGSILAVGFGTPENSHDQMASRMVALCTTASLEVIWLQDSLSYNVHDLAFASMKYGNELDPDSPKAFDLYVSTERSLERLAIRVVDKQGEALI